MKQLLRVRVLKESTVRFTSCRRTQNVPHHKLTTRKL